MPAALLLQAEVWAGQGNFVTLRRSLAFARRYSDRIRSKRQDYRVGRREGLRAGHYGAWRSVAARGIVTTVFR